MRKVCRSVFLFLIIFFYSALILQPVEVRPYLKTGNWYPRDRKVLELRIKELLKAAEKKVIKKSVFGLISPHAGFKWSGRCAASSYSLINTENINRVFILGVSHRGQFNGALISLFDSYSTPLGRIKVDTAVTRRLLIHNQFSTNRAIEIFEHSIENQLPFLQIIFANKKFRIVPILFGRLKKKDFSAIAKFISGFFDKKSIIIASSDFTHYGKAYNYLPFKKNISKNIRLLDQGIIGPICNLDFNSFFNYYRKTGITMCGISPVGALIKILENRKLKGKVVSYYRSGDITGDFIMSVSYASIIFPCNPNKIKNSMFTKEEKKTLLKIAKTAVYSRILKRREFFPGPQFNITPVLRKKYGVFVTLKKRGKLRGCIGTIVGTSPLFKLVAKMGVESATGDPRFRPITKRELKKISIEISVMTPLKQVNHFRDIRLGIDGVVLQRGFFRSVYLPQVATETGWDLERFLSNLSLKAGLKKDAYKLPGTKLLIFQAVVFSDEDN